MIVTIDGPVASGKSTVAQHLAEKLHIFYLYTGLLYRGAAFVAVYRLGIDQNNLKDLSSSDVGFISKISYDYVDGIPKIYYEGKDITDHLNLQLFGELSSIIGVNPYVREQMLPLQHSVAERYDIVADGRDCGSVVFPNAEYKFYLMASEQVRARRLMADPKRKADELTFDEALTFVRTRDERDSSRVVAPLIVPRGAIVIDNSNLSIDETVSLMLSTIRGKS